MEDKELYALGRDDLMNFSMLVNKNYIANWHHEVIAKHLMELERRVREGHNKTTFLILEIGPRSGKSELASKLFPAWFLGKNPDKKIICSSYSATLSETFSEETRNMINDYQYQQMFSTRLKADSQSKSHWRTSKDGSFRAAGVGGATTGFGAHCLVIDDAVSNREAAESLVQREMTYGWFCSTALTRLEPNGVVIMIGTRWHVQDLIGTFLEQNEGRTDIDIIRVSFPMIAERDDQYRKKGEVLWPSRYSLNHMLALKKTLPIRDWEALYQQDPIKSMGQIFRAEDFRDFAMSDFDILSGKDKPEIDRHNLKTMIFVDPAFSTRKGSDDTAITVVSWDTQKKQAYLLDGFADTVLPSQAHEIVINMADKWSGNGFVIQGIVVEENNLNKDQQLFITELKRKLKDEGKFYKMIPYKPVGKKEDRINFTLQPAFEMHSVFFRGDDHGNEFWGKLKEQMIKYPGAHDDAIDVTCMAVNYFKKKESGSTTSKKRERHQVLRPRNPLTGEEM